MDNLIVNLITYDSFKSILLSELDGNVIYCVWNDTV